MNALSHLGFTDPINLGVLKLNSRNAEQLVHDLQARGVEFGDEALKMTKQMEFMLRFFKIGAYPCVGIPLERLQSHDRSLEGAHRTAVRSRWRQLPAFCALLLFEDLLDTRKPRYPRIIVHHEPFKPTHTADPCVMTLLGDEPTVGVFQIPGESQIARDDIVVYWDPRR